MLRTPFRPIRGFRIGPPVPLADNRPTAAAVVKHDYLHCFCSARLWHGTTVSGAPIIVCRACNSIADERRMA